MLKTLWNNNSSKKINLLELNDHEQGRPLVEAQMLSSEIIICSHFKFPNLVFVNYNLIKKPNSNESLTMSTLPRVVSLIT